MTSNQNTLPFRKLVKLVTGCLLLGLVPGCTQGSYDLFLEFPDQEARDTTTLLRLWVIEPDDLTCAQLLEGALEPTEVQVRAHEEFALPAAESPRLTKVLPGNWLFFAEGAIDSGATILRGCTQARVKHGVAVEVVIRLEWICHPLAAEDIPDNLLDDDCDGLTDECESDHTCADQNPCTNDICVEGLCVNDLVTDNSNCDDGLFCTTEDVCTSGVCGGNERSCDDGQPCTTDSCDDVLNLCQNNNLPDNTSCEDNDPCTQNEECSSGICLGELTDYDEDGHVAAACGGDDCDDTSAEANPDKAEGPLGHLTCSDGLDNDCDGGGDLQDPNCLNHDICGVDGWCWEHPSPTGNPVTVVWARANDDIWFVSDDNGILRWFQDRFSHIPLEPAGKASSILGESANDFWVAGTSEDIPTIWRWEDSNWSSEPAPVAGTRLRGIAPDRIFLLGGSGEIARWDGATWNTLVSGTDEDLYGLWAAAADDIWVVGGQGTLLHGDGDSWTRITLSQTADLYAIHGSDKDNVWAVGDQGTAIQWNGTEWLAHNVPVDDPIGQIHVAAVDEVWVTIGTFGSEIWRWTGDSWTLVRTSSSDEGLNSLRGAPNGDLWFAGRNGQIERWDGLEWQTMSTALGHGQINDLVTLDSDQVWAIGWSSSLFFDGNSWTVLQVTGLDAWVLDANKVWVADGSAMVERWNGNLWEPLDSTSPAGINAIDGCADDDVWLVGDSGAVVHWDGMSFSQVDTGSTEYNWTVACIAPDDVWIGHSNGCLHFDGTDWLDGGCVNRKTVRDICVIWPNDIWATGADLVQHWDGLAWTSLQLPETIYDLFSIWSAGGGQAWAVGMMGQVLQCDSEVCTKQTSGTRSTLYGVTGEWHGLITAGEHRHILRKQF